MIPIDQRLFDDYCVPILENAEGFHEGALKALLTPAGGAGCARAA